MNVTYEDKPKTLRDRDFTHSKSPLNIFYANLFYVPHTQAKYPLAQSILRGKKTHNDTWKSTLFTFSASVQ